MGAVYSQPAEQMTALNFLSYADKRYTALVPVVIQKSANANSKLVDETKDANSRFVAGVLNILWLSKFFAHSED